VKGAPVINFRQKVMAFSKTLVNSKKYPGVSQIKLNYITFRKRPVFLYFN
jgi:hypothetical protein